MSNGNYLSTEIDIYSDDENIDLPMHAELRYNKEYDQSYQEVKTKLKKYADELIKHNEIIPLDTTE